MRKLSAYNFTTLNGYFKDAQGSTSWHEHGGQEEGEYASDAMESGGNILVFGRVTYEMMASFWPTPDALKSMPDVAKGMNSSQKIVFSNSLTKANWQNTTLIKGNMIEEMIKLKNSPGPDMTILGSGSIITQFADKGLIDAYEIMIDPIALGDGTPMFKGMSNTLKLKLNKTRTFKSGIVLLSYQSIS